MPSKIFNCCSMLLYCNLVGCLASDTLNITSKSISKEETLVSNRSRFELGFFTPSGSPNNSWYLGIWYYKLFPRTVVWVANGNNPLPDSTGTFGFDDGILRVSDQSGKSYWSAEIEERATRNPYKEAVLLDSGNLVLRYNQSEANILWQSFQHPNDTLLPGMKLSDEIQLKSWRDQGDPAQGNFTFKNDSNQFLILLNDFEPQWESKGPDLFNSTEADAKQMKIADILSNLSTSQPSMDTDWRLVMNNTGEIQYWRLNGNQWILKSWAPRDICSVENECGKFGICNANSKVRCKCLPGFIPNNQGKWDDRDFSDGCIRNEDIGGASDIFLRLSKIKVKKSDSGKLHFMNGEQCRDWCLRYSKCEAYAKEDKGAQNGIDCWFWARSLENLQEEYDGGATELFIRIATTSIKPTARSCDPCGTNLIPYPLSSGSDCGEAVYSGFRCDTSTGKTSFDAAPAVEYNVTRIDQNTRTFFIQVKEGDDCKKRNMDHISHLNQTLRSPFKLVNVTYRCDDRRGIYGYYDSSVGMDEIEISWEPPPEPTCTSSSDCKDWPNSNCNASKDGKKRCICNTNFVWNSTTLDCTQGQVSSTSPNPPERSSDNKRSLYPIFIGIIAAILFLLSATLLYLYHSRRKREISNRESLETNNRSVMFRFYDCERLAKDIIDSRQFSEDDRKEIDVPFIGLNLILAATDNFSEMNKLGEGGFGPVYKGNLPGGQIIAIKRLSSLSGQGFQEFKNEVVLIAKLQHRNLVGLLGYCVDGHERILVYEFMPNKSLDFYIFDRTWCLLLNWETRLDIIMGIARGLLYLHHDSKLRIIHRDLKTSNVLLDGEMNPKISDFGLARIFGGKQTEASTERIVGTYGYMSPEYALEGFFSIKSDVFSFGVVMLEILSGKRNTAFHMSKQGFSLVGYAWKLWEEEKLLDLMDQAICETCKADEFIRCINIGLLCVQEDPSDRPTMPSVLFMLGAEAASLPSPKRPVLAMRRSLSSILTSSSKVEDITK